MRKRLFSSFVKDTARDLDRVSRNPRHRLERIFADLRAGLVAAAAVIAFDTLTMPVAIVAIVVFYFSTPWEV